MDEAPTTQGRRPHLVRAPAHTPGRPGDRPLKRRAALTAVPTGGNLGVPLIRVSVLSASPMTRIGIRGLIETASSRVVIVADTLIGRHRRTDVTILDAAALNHAELHGATGRATRRSNAVIAIAAATDSELPILLRTLGVRICISPEISGPDLVATIESAAATSGAAPVRQTQTPDLYRVTEANVHPASPSEDQVSP